MSSQQTHEHQGGRLTWRRDSSVDASSDTPVDIVAAIGLLARTANGAFSIDEMLQDLCRVAVATLDIDGAGVMVAAADCLRFVHAQPADIVVVEQLQELLQRGPCQDSLRTREVVVVENVHSGDADDRWPEFSTNAELLGIRSAVAMPLLARGRVWGVLDLYRTRELGWNAEYLAVAAMLADVAASYIVMAADRNLVEQSQGSLHHSSTHDTLTDLPNRALLMDRLEHAVTNAARRHTMLAVLFLDIDHFKRVNDLYGHAVGDFVLVEVGRRLAAALRETDTLARLGGDEFVVICEDFAGSKADAERQLTEIGDRINAVVGATPIHVSGIDVTVSFSIGAAVATPHITSTDLVLSADNAMYVAKQRGRARLVVGGREETLRLGSARKLERELHQALRRGELRVHYQPIVAVDRGLGPPAAEALIRWQHPTRGLLPASAFIGAAGRTGLIRPIGQWLIEQVCGQLERWSGANDGPGPERVFVNLSPQELADPDLGAKMSGSLKRHGLTAHQLGIEIVEEDFTEPVLLARIAEHRARGHALSIDDFGTGYSSLARLVDVPAEYAKVDASVVAGLPDDDRSRSLMEAVILVGHHLGLQIVAEGIENATQARAVREAGGDFLQGNHIGAPQTGDLLTRTWQLL
jgi:diguanylate cyclase (GGDEF)-like protein